ncbi:stalk domain-containing protein [Alkalicoccus urumqiensis]|uniref:Copper amine oxidase-like N-terminal domain-containing protein n=1 Tax=Alkalicoccus urumqiensis TaxID=1548213 RepID=A0A2P6MK04_ALKUR|nr:stalk domain-containing protein [Alkalicoccus urumqiensis]PRO66588.1 hypothetical protein C6I21_04390 [Alkalicoccus urumqiensis]
MKKVICVLFSVFFLSIFISGQAIAGSEIDKSSATLVVNEIKKSPSISIYQDRTLAPSSMIANALNADMEWNDSEKIATIEKENTIISFDQTTNQVKINGDLKNPKVKPIWLNSTENTGDSTNLENVLFPVRFVSEALGANVGWDNNLKIASVNYKEDYNTAGTVAELNEEKERVLINISKTAYGYEDQMFIQINENIEILNKQGDSLNFESINMGDELKTNITSACLEDGVSICTPDDFVIINSADVE